MPRIRLFGLALAIVALTHATAAAQEFDTDKIRVGQTVLVRDLKGAEVKGIVQSADLSRLVVGTRVFTPAEVDRVLRPGPIWDGAVKGALIAGITTLLVGATLGEGCYGCGEAFVASSLIGAGIGVGIDAAWGPKTVYHNRGGTRKVTLAPVIGKSRRGLAASIRF